MAQMLCKIDNFRNLDFTQIVARCFHVHSDVLIANFGCELSIINLSIFTAIAPCLEMFKTFAHPLFVIELAVILLAFILGPFLPSIHVEAISEHQQKLHHYRVVIIVHHARALTQIDGEELITVQHIFARLRHTLDINGNIFEIFGGSVLLLDLRFIAFTSVAGGI